MQFSLSQFVLDTVSEFVKNNGTLVSPLQKERRKEVCFNCPFLGMVKPVEGVETEGCTICTCPIETKAAMLTIQRLNKSKIGKPVTKKEALQVRFLLDTGQVHKTVTEVVDCPHKGGSKWKDVDRLYENYSN